MVSLLDFLVAGSPCGRRNEVVGGLRRLLATSRTIEERARLRARAFARARGCARGVFVEGGARMRAQARNADV